MSIIVILLALILLVLLWAFIVEPILDGLGGFAPGLKQGLNRPDVKSALSAQN